MILRRFFVPTIASLLLSACASPVLMQQPPLAQLVASRASAGPLALVDAALLTDNDGAFAAKLQLVEGAQRELALAYYIFSDDHSSARLAQALIDAARRGVQVRLLVDYLSGYKQLDHFSWLQQQGGGRIEVRLYNRPTSEIIKDAAFLTLSCAAVGSPGNACDLQKIAAVERAFGAAGDEPLNRHVAGSGLFLSGLYGKHAKLMAYAVMRGQDIDAPAVMTGAAGDDAGRLEQLKELGKLYFKARYVGGMDGLVAKIKLGFVRLAFAEQVNPVFDALNSYLPLTRQKSREAQQDWDYLTEFLHHKLLLADRRALVLGGRNVEDSYHLNPSPLADKYIFMDSDARLQLAAVDDALASSFDRLWNLRSMVATLAEVRRHAPNDLLVNFDVISAAQDRCAEGTDQRCIDAELARHFVTLPVRLQSEGEKHHRRLLRYMNDYRPAPASLPMAIDGAATVHYFENLPVAGDRRVYGARMDREAAASKNIHALWRAALQSVCAAGNAEQPREVIFHNAYLFMPANLLRDVAASLDGTRRCAGVTITILTNSLATTDLNVVNLLAAWQLKALADHLTDHGRADGAAASGSARLRYLEYEPVADARLSLHTKVMLFDRDIFIGSANADVRSLMMDSNNGIFVSNAPRFVDAYRARLHSIIAQPGRVAERTADMGRDRERIAVEMNQLIDQLLARYAGEERLDAQQRTTLKAEITATTDRVYDLCRRIMNGDADAADQFNGLFKAI